MKPLDFEAALERSLDSHLMASGVPQSLVESIRYSLLAPGKRIRPRLALECARLLGLAPEAGIAAAISLEMVHCFTLIHDDLPCMDDDDFRRGRPSNHRQFNESTALLAGDGLLALAFDALLDAEPHVEPRNLLRAVRELATASGPRGVIGGQGLEETLGADSRIEDLRTMHAKKTGALFEASLLLPKALHGIQATDPRSQAIDHFASELGLAFQVMDDLDDAATEECDPTNILFYLSEADARAQTLTSLTAACAGLERAWGEPSHPLLAIAREVSVRIALPVRGNS